MSNNDRKPKTRKEAKIEGVTQYFTGEPCPRGHVAPRMTSTHACVVCKRARVSEYNKSDKGKAKTLERASTADAKRKKKEWRDSDHGKALRKESWKKWYEENKHLMNSLSSKKRAEALNRAVGWADCRVIKDIYKTARLLNKVVDHVVPLQGKSVCGLHVHNNLAVVDAEHNARKSNKFDDSELGPMVYSPNRKMFPYEVMNLVVKELVHQREKYGSIEDNPHEAGTWLLLIQDELDEAKRGLIKGGSGRDSWTYELIQVAALCVAALMQLGMTDKEGRAI